MVFSKNSRFGKRPSNSSSSYLFTVTMVVILAFFLLGVWMLTASSVITPQTQKQTFSAASRIEAKDPDLMDDAEHIPDNYHSTSSSSSLKPDEDLGRRALRPPIEQEEERQVEQQREIESDDAERLESGRGGSAVGGDMETTTGDGDEKQLEIEDKPRKEDQQDNFKDDEKQRPTDEGEEREAVTQEDQENEAEQGATEGDKVKEKAEDIVEVENQLQSQIEEAQEKQQSETDESVENGQHQMETVENQQPQTDDNAVTQQLETEESVENQQSPREESGENQKSETEENVKELNSNESFPDGAQSEISRETNFEQGSWATQADQSENEKERQVASVPEEKVNNETDRSVEDQDGANYGYRWDLCNVTSGPDYIPCLDNEKALKQLHSTKHFEHRERHCPDESPTCLVPLPKGYKPSVAWPKSRDKIWYNNVPNTKLAAVKGHQNWVKATGEYLTFPGGGTQFIHGALHYIDFIQQSVPYIAWGKRTRVILDVGCGVASFGGYLFERDVLAMSFAPKDEHEAQVQFALERGIPAISAVMGSKRLPFPSGVFDIVHCARCRVPWHAEGGMLLLELNRILRPGGYFVWSATPVYQKLKEDVEIWKAMSSLTISMCWDLLTIKKDKLNSVGAAIYRKPTSNECYENRKQNSPPMCEEKDDPDAAWYVPLQACMHRVPEDSSRRGSHWPEQWPVRLQTPPYWLNRSQVGVYGRAVPEDFLSDYQHWKRVVTKSYLDGLGIDLSTVRNVMDMRAVYGGFAAALRNLKVWVMNVVNVDSLDTLPIIYERGLFGIYHDWCESFSTYPRTYDLLHADHLFSRLKERCNIIAVMAEIDRILRPGGKLIVRDESSSVSEIESLVKSLHWEVRLSFSKDSKRILCAQKTDWRPDTFSGPL